MTDDDDLAADLRGFGPLGIIAILVIVLTSYITVGTIVLPVGAVLALVWVRLSRTPWREIGYTRPRSWILTILTGFTLGIALKFLMKALVMPLLGADPVNRAYHSLAGNDALLPSAIWAMFAAGFGEETIFRGFAFERLRRLLGQSMRAAVAIVLMTSMWFGLAHIQNQGADGAAQATITGLTFGTIYAATGQIWVPMIAHASFDLTALWIIYSDLEIRVAHLVFS